MKLSDCIANVEIYLKTLEHDIANGLSSYVKINGLEEVLQAAKAFEEIAINKMMWTYEIDGEIADLECDTPDKVQEYANEKFEDYCAENEIYHSRQPIVLIGFECDENQGRAVKKTIPSEVEYQYEPSMREQHGNP